MSAIDTQNAKQIRDPMDVLIELDVRDDISMTYSGYSSTAKVADGNLKSSYTMRKLADLQGDGFALDGTAKLYKYLYPTPVNGKIGVRGNVGQSVDVTASSTSTIKALSLTVKNAASVTVGGTTTSIVGNQAIIQVNANSVTMTFNPADATHRVEVNLAIPGTVLTINNDNLIRATVSLRSDLSLHGQTLPESELNVEVYNDMDISEAVAGIAEDVPITYQAGYPGDMSPVRKFYVSGQVTWKDNILSIHAVDAVHFLDRYETEAPLTYYGILIFIQIAKNLLYDAGVSYNDRTTAIQSNGYRWLVTKGISARDFISFCNIFLNITDSDGVLLDGSGTMPDPMQFCYRDAGIPTMFSRGGQRESAISIDEEDCGDVVRSAEREIASIDATIHSFVTEYFSPTKDYVQKVGTATWVKDVGTSLSFDKYAKDWAIGLYLGANYDNEVADKLTAAYGGVYSAWGVMVVTVPANTGPSWNGFGTAGYWSGVHPFTGDILPNSDVPQESFGNGGWKSYSLFIPWSQSYNGTWNYDGLHTITTSLQSWNMLKNAGIFQSDAKSVDLDIYGVAYDFDAKKVSYVGASQGQSISYGELPIYGRINAVASGNTFELFPEKALQIPFYRSKVTGSFKWKGDPRLQPRDIIWFEHLDGSGEYITLENITLTHERGGTSAEITYRKGVI